MLAGSYHNGFAPRDGQPLYPELWRGCIGAWAPCLGPSGLTLRDWSGYQRHGTLAGYALGTDVGLARGINSIQNAASKTISCGPNWISGLTTLTLSAWMFRSAASEVQGIGRVGAGSGRVGILAFSDSSIYFTVDSPSNIFTRVLQAPTGWFHVVLRYDGGLAAGSRIAAFVNGISAAGTVSGTPPVSIPANTNNFELARDDTGRTTTGRTGAVMLHSRCLSDREIALLASRQGIEFDLAPRRRSGVFTAGGFRAFWATRKAQIIGGGLQ